MKIFKNWLVSLFLLILIIPSCKVKDEIANSKMSTQKDEYQKLENALLWKIEGNELKEPSYLYGTIHIINSDDYFLPEGTLAAMGATDKMVFEIDMNEMSDMSNLMGIMTQAFMKDNLTLKDLLTEEDYKLVNDHFNKKGLPLMMLERIKPMFLSAFAYGDLDPTSIESGAMKSYEMEFFEMAESSGKAVGGLETMEFQMSVFDSIPYKDQADMLVETIKKSDTGSDEFDAMIKMYKDQDISAMISMISDEDELLSDHEDILVSKRNKNWIPKMGEMMNTQPTFFAVGAGHLASKIGVIHLLRKEGYKVTPISNKK